MEHHETEYAAPAQAVGVGAVAGADAKKRRRLFGGYGHHSDRAHGGLGDAMDAGDADVGGDGQSPRRGPRHGLLALAKPTEIVAILGILAALLTAFGFRYTSIASVEARVTALEKKGDLNSFILCAMARRQAPDIEPPECAPVILNHEQRQAAK